MKQDDTPTPQFLTIRELATRWKITPMTLRRWRKAGHLKIAFLGRGVRISMTEVERFEREAEA